MHFGLILTIILFDSSRLTTIANFPIIIKASKAYHKLLWKKLLPFFFVKREKILLFCRFSLFKEETVVTGVKEAFKDEEVSYLL